MIVIALAGVLALVCCDAGADRPQVSDSGAAPVRAVVSIPPLKALVEPFVAALADVNDGASGTVEILIPPGVSEHGYEIPPTRLAALAKADVVVYVGLGLEPQVEDFLKDHPSPTRRVVEFAKMAGVEANDDHDHHEHAHDDHDHPHDHDHDHDHAHGRDGQDPHLWLDPVLVMKLVPAIRQAVEQAAIARAPKGTPRLALIKGRLDVAEKALLERVRAVDEEHRTRLAGHQGGGGRAVVVAHDAWGLLAARYGFETVAIKGMLATEPTPQSIKAAVEAIRVRGATVVFTEPQLAQATSQRVADAAGAKLMELDPLGSGDWFSTMRANLDNIVAALDAHRPATTPTPPAPANR